MEASPYKIFISYSHEDEYLVNELKAHLYNHIRDGIATVWHDREIIPGTNWEEEIDSNLENSHVMIMVISSDFIASRYCYEKEFERARELRDEGRLHIVPVIARKCNWFTNELKGIQAWPKDGVPVNPVGASRDQKELRDDGWTEVSKGIGMVFELLDKKKESIELTDLYIEKRVLELDFDHPKLDNADLSDIFFDPELVYYESEEILDGVDELTDLAMGTNPIIISGEDQSGKSCTLKSLQASLCDSAIPTVLINASDIKNADIDSLIRREKNYQLQDSPHMISECVIIIDDIEESSLSEHLLIQIVLHTQKSYRNIIISSFAPLQQYLFIEGTNNEPINLTINPIPTHRIYQCVDTWVSAGADKTTPKDHERNVTHIAKNLLSLFKGDTIPIYPGMIIQFLKIIESTAGTDISITSNAACYDALVSLQLVKFEVQNNKIDLIKRTLGQVAYTIYKNPHFDSISHEQFSEIVDDINTDFFESLDFKELQSTLVSSKFLERTEKSLRFRNEFLSYFFAGFYIAKVLRKKDPEAYQYEINNNIDKIQKRRDANIILFTLYFSQDETIFSRLIENLNALFLVGNGDWELSDSTIPKLRTRGLKLQMLLEENDEEEQNSRVVDLRKEHTDFLASQVGFAETMISPFTAKNYDDIDRSYFSNMNKLFRLQTVLASAMNVKSGAFERDILLKSVNAMVKASGRFAYANLYIASDIVTDPTDAKSQLKKDYQVDSETGNTASEEEFISTNLEKLVDYFSWWSIAVSQGFLGRALSAQNTVKVLEHLHTENELQDNGTPIEKRPFNFAAALGGAKLWGNTTASLDSDFFNIKLAKYGSNHPLRDFYKLSLFVFSRVIPLNHYERQWLSKTFDMPLKGIRQKQRHMPAQITNRGDRKRKLKKKKEKTKK